MDNLKGCHVTYALIDIKMKAMIFNNEGLGNGVIIYPVLLNTNIAEYYHQENDFLLYNKSNLPCLKSFFPKIWRRFKEIENILGYIDSNSIDTIINIRKEDVKYDLDYNSFKYQALEKNLKVFDFYNSNVSNSQSIGHQITKVFEQISPIDGINWKWLNESKNKNFDIMVYIGSNIESKSLNVSQTMNLIYGLDNDLNKILVCAGKNNYEKELIDKIRRNNTSSNVSFENFFSIDSAIDALYKSRAILTVDSYMSHLAGSTISPVTTIFLKTNSKIWRNATQEDSQIVQSTMPLECVEMKDDGTCKNFYSNCAGCKAIDLDFYAIGNRFIDQYGKK